jgi:hypothetical protein
MNADQSFELLRADIDAHVRRRLSEAIGGLQQRVAALRGLVGGLEATGEVPLDAGQERLEETATCIRALATEALTSSIVCIGISERIRAYASVRGIVSAPPELTGAGTDD